MASKKRSFAGFRPRMGKKKATYARSFANNHSLGGRSGSFGGISLSSPILSPKKERKRSSMLPDRFDFSDVNALVRPRSSTNFFENRNWEMMHILKEKEDLIRKMKQDNTELLAEYKNSMSELKSVYDELTDVIEKLDAVTEQLVDSESSNEDLRGSLAQIECQLDLHHRAIESIRKGVLAPLRHTSPVRQGLVMAMLPDLSPKEIMEVLQVSASLVTRARKLVTNPLLINYRSGVTRKRIQMNVKSHFTDFLGDTIPPPSGRPWYRSPFTKLTLFEKFCESFY